MPSCPLCGGSLGFSSPEGRADSCWVAISVCQLSEEGHLIRRAAYFGCHLHLGREREALKLRNSQVN
eukprot:2470216-Amphidinium_carterae.1